MLEDFIQVQPKLLATFGQLSGVAGTKSQFIAELQVEPLFDFTVQVDDFTLQYPG